MSDRKFPCLAVLCFAAGVGAILEFSHSSTAQQSVPIQSVQQVQQVTPCRQLGKGNTVVIIEASNRERMQLVNRVVGQHKLQGQFCASNRTGRTVWMSNQLNSVETAVKMFDYFRGVGLVSPVNLNGNNEQLQKQIPTSPYPAMPNNSPNQNVNPDGQGMRL